MLDHGRLRSFRMFVWGALWVSVVVLFLLQIWRSNSDLRLGRYVLFMDEHVSFDGLLRIFESDSFTTFIKSVVGPDQRYGRIFWYGPAPFVYPFKLIFGAEGQIVATRMFHAFVLLVSYFIFCFSMCKSKICRLLLFILLLLLPSTSYYSSMPKPEPLLLLFLSLFFLQWRPSVNYQGSAWIFLGLAFGTKISILPLVPMVMLASYVRFSPKVEVFKVQLVRSIKSFVLGLVIAAPGLVVHPLSWIKQTLLNTGHGADNSNTNIFDWLRFVFREWSGVPSLVLVVVTVVVFISIVLLAIWYIKAKFRTHSSEDGRPLFILFAGLVMNLLIMLTVKRVWDFYLHVGAVIFLVGFVATLEYAWSRYGSRRMSYLLVICWVAVVPFQVRAAVICYDNLAHRTATEEYRRQIDIFNSVTGELISLSDSLNRRLAVFYDPRLFVPDSTSKFDVTVFWGPFTDFQKRTDALVLTDEQLPGQKPVPDSSALKSQQLESYRLIETHIARSAVECRASPCYVERPLGLRGAKVFFLVNS